jgi:carbamate kinase
VTVCGFIEHRGRRGVITSLDRIPEAVAGRAGTVVVPA